MTTLYISHPECMSHDMGSHHPESPARLGVIFKMVDELPWVDQLKRETAPQIDTILLNDVHSADYLRRLSELKPSEGLVALDGDTSLNPHSIKAAQFAAGASVRAVEAVMDEQIDNAFCAVRPPGHHAESISGMGFCIYNSIALAAERALSLGAERIAILDFDVHHGNGTTEIFQNRPEVMVCSSFQYPFYPGRYDDIDRKHIVLTPLAAGTASAAFKTAIERDWLPALQSHQPDIILVSAGFDDHREDPLGSLMLEDEDYLWLTQLIANSAEQLCNGKIVSMLEGGYHLDALARSVKLHLSALARQ
jgi:acetoin utilization deacetylase AcuC-like enzyme